MKMTFIGATHEVTGSCTYIEACGKRFLVDFGMQQGEDIFENVQVPVAPSQIDFVLLTHAHIDHSGLLCRRISGRDTRDRGYCEPLLGNAPRLCSHSGV